MSLEKLLEETDEGGWITLETVTDEVYYGRLQKYDKEFTKRQRNKLKGIKEEQGRGEAKETAQKMEAEGNIIKFNLYNPITDEEYTVNPMSENILGKREGQNKREELIVDDLYRETKEEVMTQISPEIEMRTEVEEVEGDERLDSYSLDELKKVSYSRLE